MLRNIIAESLEDLEISPDPEMAMLLLKSIIEEIPMIPEKNLKAYVDYLATHKLPQILLKIPKKE